MQYEDNFLYKLSNRKVVVTLNTDTPLVGKARLGLVLEYTGSVPYLNVDSYSSLPKQEHINAYSRMAYNAEIAYNIAINTM